MESFGNSKIREPITIDAAMAFTSNVESKDRNATYVLAAVACHSGRSLSGGHYYCLTPKSHSPESSDPGLSDPRYKWIKHDDASRCLIENIDESETYVALYNRI